MGFEYQKEEVSDKGNFFKWTAFGQSVEGRFQGLTQGSYEGRPTHAALFVQENGTVLKVNAPTMLRRVLTEKYAPGAQLRVVYVRDEKGRQPQPTKIFEFYKASVPGAVVQPQAAQPPVAQPAPVPAAPTVSEYDQLSAKLLAHAGEGPGKAMLGALGTMYPDPAMRLEQLKTALAAQGVK